jgi:hypothetical protein
MLRTENLHKRLERIFEKKNKTNKCPKAVNKVNDQDLDQDRDPAQKVIRMLSPLHIIRRKMLRRNL